MISISPKMKNPYTNIELKNMSIPHPDHAILPRKRMHVFYSNFNGVSDSTDVSVC